MSAECPILRGNPNFCPFNPSIHNVLENGPHLFSELLNCDSEIESRYVLAPRVTASCAVGPFWLTCGGLIYEDSRIVVTANAFVSYFVVDDHTDRTTIPHILEKEVKVYQHDAPFLW